MENDALSNATDLIPCSYQCSPVPCDLAGLSPGDLRCAMGEPLYLSVTSQHWRQRSAEQRQHCRDLASSPSSSHCTHLRLPALLARHPSGSCSRGDQPRLPLQEPPERVRGSLFHKIQHRPSQEPIAPNVRSERSAGCARQAALQHHAAPYREMREPIFGDAREILCCGLYFRFLFTQLKKCKKDFRTNSNEFGRVGTLMPSTICTWHHVACTKKCQKKRCFGSHILGYFGHQALGRTLTCF